MWAMLVLIDVAADHSSSAHVEKAMCWLGAETLGKSTEWWAVRSMLERQFGHADKAGQYRGELLKRQRADGGWGWLCDEESDALATGIALYSLAGEQDAQAAIARAREFLARSQRADGSWAVHGTKENAKTRITPTATFLGTCWAVIGLCETEGLKPPLPKE